MSSDKVLLSWVINPAQKGPLNFNEGLECTFNTAGEVFQFKI